MKGQIPCVASLVAVLACGALQPAWAGHGLALIRVEQSDTQREVEKELRDEKDLRRIDVSVTGSEATLAGLVPHLYAKNEAIRLALEVDGIETVVSEIELPEEVSDAELAEAVGRAVLDYVHYTLWDYVDAWVNEGVVSVLGSFTPDRDKKRELYRKIARIPGVRDYVDRIEVLSPSSSDRRTRARISQLLGRSVHFDRYRNTTNTPFHIIVSNGAVTLKGYVQDQIEYIEMQSIVGQIGGVLRVDNQLQLLKP